MCLGMKLCNVVSYNNKGLLYGGFNRSGGEEGPCIPDKPSDLSDSGYNAR